MYHCSHQTTNQHLWTSMKEKTLKPSFIIIIIKKFYHKTDQYSKTYLKYTVPIRSNVKVSLRMWFYGISHGTIISYFPLESITAQMQLHIFISVNLKLVSAIFKRQMYFFVISNEIQ